MKIKTTDEEIARFASMCTAIALLKAGIDLRGSDLIDMKNALKKDITEHYHNSISIFDKLVNGTFYTN